MRALMESGKVPVYVNAVVELLMETCEEVRELSRRNAELVEEIKILKEENLFLKGELLKAQS